MVYIKFLCIVSIESGIIPLIYFYNKDNYLGWDIDNNYGGLNGPYNHVEIQNMYKNKKIDSN